MSKLRVIAKPHGWSIYHANCCECQWGACIFTPQTPSEESVRRAAKAHVRKTGHEVTLETARSANYCLAG